MGGGVGRGQVGGLGLNASLERLSTVSMWGCDAFLEELYEITVEYHVAVLGLTRQRQQLGCARSPDCCHGWKCPARHISAFTFRN